MRRYRNTRYAPESLERKLNPSTMSVAPAAADVTTVTTATTTTTPVVVNSTDTVIVDGSQGYGFNTTGTASNPTTVVDLSGSDAPDYTASLTDYVIAGTDAGDDSTDGTGDVSGDSTGDDSPLPGDGPMPLVPSTNIVGPVVAG